MGYDQGSLVSDTRLVIGQISITLREPPANTAQIACGHVVLDAGYAAGYRFFSELTKIREALVAAQAVLVDRANFGYATTPAEVHLASKLVELEVTPDWNGTLGKLAGEAP
jgi:hypothetical protein